MTAQSERDLGRGNDMPTSERIHATIDDLCMLLSMLLCAERERRDVVARSESDAGN
jgi:hypothetical protein